MKNSKLSIEESLDQWGQRTVFVARDYTISLLMNELKNTDKLPKKVGTAIQTLNKEQLFALKYLLLSCIDTSFHNTLWSIESYPEHKLMLGQTKEHFLDLDEELNITFGTGITGAILDYIDKFSKYNAIDEFLKTGKLEKEITDKR